MAGAFDEADHLVEQRCVARHLDVVRRCVGQPQQVVGEMRAHAGAAGHVPPVLHVAFGKLARRVHQNLLAQARRVGEREGHRVLQLVAKAEGAAGLVEAGLRPEPARQRLVHQPAVDQRIEQRIGRAHLQAAQQVVPEATAPAPALRARRAGASGAPARAPRRRAGVAQHEAEARGFASRNHEFAADGRAGVEPAAGAPRQRVGHLDDAVAGEELAAVAGPLRGPGRRALQARKQQKGRAAAEARARLALLAEHGRLVFGLPAMHGAPFAARGAQLPLDHGERAQAALAGAFVAHAHVHQLDGLVAVSEEGGFQHQAPCRHSNTE
jgi:hypothetical protein